MKATKHQEFLTGLVRLHVLHHAVEGEFFGSPGAGLCGLDDAAVGAGAIGDSPESFDLGLGHDQGHVDLCEKCSLQIMKLVKKLGLPLEVPRSKE